MLRRNIERNAGRGRWGPILLAAVPFLACGEDSPPETPVPAPEVVREEYGLGVESTGDPAVPGVACFRYTAGNVSATATVEGPNTSSIIGRTVYRWTFRQQNGGLPEEWFFDTESAGEVRLLRAVQGATASERETRNYFATGPAPLFYKLDLDRNGVPQLAGDARFLTEVTPECIGDGCPDSVGLERYEWTVQTTNASVNTPEGEATAIQLLYRRTIGATQESAEYTLVPGRGFARIRTFDDTIYQICNWRYCDRDGNCFGAASCEEADLRCN